MNDVHVIPIDDYIEHEETDDCPCGPETRFLDDGGFFYIHHSLDGREFSEEDSDLSS